MANLANLAKAMAQSVGGIPSPMLGRDWLDSAAHGRSGILYQYFKDGTLEEQRVRLTMGHWVLPVLDSLWQPVQVLE